MPGADRRPAFSSDRGRIVRPAGSGIVLRIVTFAGLFVGTIVFASGRRQITAGAHLRFRAALVRRWRPSSWRCRIRAAASCIWRFIAGVGVGVELVTIDTYVTELVPKSTRGRTFAINQAIQFARVPVAAILSWLLIAIASPLGIAGWRWVVVVPVIGALLVWWIRLAVPESPRWLAQHGRSPKPTRHRPVETQVAAESEAAAAGAAAGGGRERRRADFPRSGSRLIVRRTIMLSVFNFFQTIGFYGFGNWVPHC